MEQRTERETGREGGERQEKKLERRSETKKERREGVRKEERKGWRNKRWKKRLGKSK